MSIKSWPTQSVNFLQAEWLIETNGNEKDIETIKLIRKASLKGHLKAQIHLANILSISPNEEDRIEACSWAKKAAATGNQEAKEMLSHLYKIMPADLLKKAE